jgi:flagellin
MLVLNTNTQSHIAQRSLRSNTHRALESVEKLATGKKINSASDDAAGLSMAQKFESEIRGFDRAINNALDGVNLINSMDGVISIVQDNIQEIRALYIQGVNGTNGLEEKDAIQSEINARITTIQDLIRTEPTQIATNPPYTATMGMLFNHPDVFFQTGAYQGEKTKLALDQNSVQGPPYDPTVVPPQTGIDFNVNWRVSGTLSDYGQFVEGVSIIGYRFGDLRIPGTSLDSYIGLNQDLGTVEENIEAFDTIISTVGRMRGYLGSMMNALEAKVGYLHVAKQSAMASKSRIEDVDMAQEAAKNVSSEILQKSAGAMLVQANSQPAIALEILPKG